MLLYLLECLHGLFLNKLRLFKLLPLLSLPHHLLCIVFKRLFLSDLRYFLATSNLDHLLLHDLFLTQLLIETLHLIELLQHAQIQVVLLLGQGLVHKFQGVLTRRQHLVRLQRGVLRALDRHVADVKVIEHLEFEECFVFLVGVVLDTELDVSKLFKFIDLSC